MKAAGYEHQRWECLRCRKQSDLSPLHHGLSNIGWLLRRYPQPSCLFAWGSDQKTGRHCSRRSDAGRGQLRLEPAGTVARKGRALT
jgi:hypothetical protein